MATTNSSLNSANKAVLDAIIQNASEAGKKTREKGSNKKKLETRRAIEDYLETRRMRRDLEDYFLED